MWIIGRYGFISLVAHDRDPDLVQVRARVKQDITGWFPDARVEVTRRADYRYRADVTRREVADVLWHEVMNYDVTSHVKDVAVAESFPNPERRRAYYACWSALARMQPHPPGGRRRKTKATVR